MNLKDHEQNQGEGWLSVGVIAQRQSTSGFSQRPWVGLPVAPPFIHFNGLWTVIALIVFD